MHLKTKGRKKQIFHDNVFNGSDNVNNVCKLSKKTIPINLHKGYDYES